MIPAARTPTTREWGLAVLVALVAALLLWAFQPAFTVPADAAAVKMEARHLLRTGELGIPVDAPDAPRALMPPHAQPGQYFTLNAARGRLMSRWGGWATLYFLVPLALSEPGVPTSELPFLNAWNVLWGGLLVLGLLILCLAVGAGFPSSLLATGSVVLGSYALFYIRAHTTELPQMTAAVWMVASMQLFRKRPRAGWLLLSLACASLLFALKLYFFPLLVGLLVLTVRTLRGNPDATRLVVLATVVIAVVGLLRGLLNLHEFGDFFALGVGPENPENPGDFAGVHHYPHCLTKYVAGPRGSLVLHAPFLVLSMPGLLLLWRRDRSMFACLLMTLGLLVLVAGSTLNCLGEWSHGPRWLLPGVPPLAAALALGLEGISALRVTHVTRRLFKATSLLVLCAGAWLEWPVLQFYPFTFYQLEGMLLRQLNPSADARAYFAQMPQAVVLGDFQEFCRGEHNNALTLLIALGVEGLPPERTRHALAGIRGLCMPNLRWAQSAK